MEKRNLKTLIADLERAIAEIKAEVYSDTSAYRIDSGDGIKSYAQVNDEDGECDWNPTLEYMMMYCPKINAKI